MQELLQKIPDDAESLSVLVGGVNFLDTPLVVFVRLRQSHLLGNLTEVPIPVRFIYLTLGPRDMMDYHEVGRAMATLMTDKVNNMSEIILNIRAFIVCSVSMKWHMWH